VKVTSGDVPSSQTAIVPAIVAVGSGLTVTETSTGKGLAQPFAFVSRT